MGILNKLAFWRKDDEFDFDKEFAEAGTEHKSDLFAESESERGGEQKQDLFGEQMPQTEGFAKPSRSPLAPSISPTPQRSMDLDLVNSKLDTIKAQLSSIEQRLTIIERSLGTEQKQKLW